MTKYNPQLAESLERDAAFFKAEAERIQKLLRISPKLAERPISTEEYGLHWLTTRRAREYDIPLPTHNTHAHILVLAREVMRVTSRLHSQQMIARIQRDIEERKGKE